VNVIILMSDTLRRDHVAAYGVPAPWQRPGHDAEPFIRTPQLDRLAAESAVFDRFYCGSYPTIPCRYDCFTGQYGFPARGWQPLDPDDVILSELTGRRGYVSMLIYDTPMLGNDAYNFTRGFSGYDFVRGQHADRYNVDPIDPPLPAAPHKLKNVAAAKLYLRNTAHRRSERDWMCAKTVTTATDWLERNRTRDNFVLWVDMWDPHEPFDAPDFDLARYADPTFHGDAIIYPQYGRPDYMSESERNHVRALYAGLVTCVDRQVGRVMQTIETVGLLEKTLVVFLSDHGHLFGDHDLEGKPTGPLGRLYEVTTRVPLLIRHPRGVGAGRRIDGLAQHPDLLPTVLEFLDAPPPDSLAGKSLWPLIEGKTRAQREYAFSGRYSRLADSLPARQVSSRDADTFDGWAGRDLGAEPVTVTTEKWAYLYSPAGPVHELYDLESDPAQLHNLADSQCPIVDRCRAALLDFLAAAGASGDRVAEYRDGRPRLTLDLSTPLYAIQDHARQWLAYPSEAAATAMLGPAIASRSPEPIRFGALLDRQPRALVQQHEQYYRAEDIG
jgi:arylsulfatase A-like enzyme